MSDHAAMRKIDAELLTGGSVAAGRYRDLQISGSAKGVRVFSALLLRGSGTTPLTAYRIVAAYDRRGTGKITVKEHVMPGLADAPGDWLQLEATTLEIGRPYAAVEIEGGSGDFFSAFTIIERGSDPDKLAAAVEAA